MVYGHGLAVTFDLAQMTARSGAARRAGMALPVITPPRTYEADLAKIYIRVLQVASGYVSARLVPTYKTSIASLADGLTVDSPTQLQGEIEGLGSDLQRLVLTLVPELRTWVVRTEAWHRARWTANIKTATTISLETLLGPTEVQTTMEAVLAANIALVKDVSAQVQGRIAQAVWGGFQRRAPVRDVAKEINEALDLGKKRSKRIAQDQLQKLSARLDDERREQAGIDTWKWRSSHKLKFRPEHQARDGNLYTEKTAPADRPGMLPFCGCKAQAWISFE